MQEQIRNHNAKKTQQNQKHHHKYEQNQKHININPKQKGEVLTEHHTVLAADWLQHMSIWETTENEELEEVYSNKKYEPKGIDRWFIYNIHMMVF